MFTIFGTAVCNHKRAWSQADTIAEVDVIREQQLKLMQLGSTEADATQEQLSLAT